MYNLYTYTFKASLVYEIFTPLQLYLLITVILNNTITSIRDDLFLRNIE